MAEAARLFIGGEWREADRTMPVRDPYTGETVREVGVGSARDIRDAIRAARDAFSTTRRLARDERSSLLAEMAAGIGGAAEELADLIVREAGKPITYARGEVARAVQTFTLASHEVLRFGGEVVPIDIAPHARGYRAITDRFPRGPVAAISPFNFPLNLVAHKVAPALAVGATVVHKPASSTPLTALRLARIAEEAGVPAGAYNVVPCPGATGEILVRDDRLRFVTFTGSPEVGWHLKAVSGRKPVTLELGGNAGVIVHEDADLAHAARSCVIGAFAYAGQVCISVQRIYVHHRVHDRFVRRLLAAVREMRIGDPTHPDCVMSAVIDDASAERILAWIREAKDGGAKVLAGGRRRRGNLIAPTVLTGTRKTMKVCAEEVFGPVVVVEPYRRFSDAVRRVDDSRYGLQAGVFSRDLNLVHRAFEEIEVGGLVVNQVPTFRVDAYPYGGVKDSGLGREGVRYAMEEMTEPRILVMNLGT
jgi:acyl-CoA reductase-like NAD-dependent aldehyde dehydrogenase